MMSFSCVSSVVIVIMSVSVCIASPRPDTRKTNMKISIENSSLQIQQWHRSAIKSSKQLAADENVQEDAKASLGHGNTTFKVAESSLPVFIHKIFKESATKIINLALLDPDRVNPFLRSKRSNCETPANLPQLLINLNTPLIAQKLVGLNLGVSTQQAALTSQFNSCPRAIGDWWPRAEVNLRSTCPWKMQQVDLGVNAFPRYVNTAVCLCEESCVGAPSMKCIEMTYNLTYFKRTGCQNGLAVMEQIKYQVNIGCNCVAAVSQGTIRNFNLE